MSFRSKFAWGGLPALLALLSVTDVARAGMPAQPTGPAWQSVLAWNAEEMPSSEIQGIPTDVEQSELRVRVGDDPAWAAPNFDDSGWAVANRMDVERIHLFEPPSESVWMVG